MRILVIHLIAVAVGAGVAELMIRHFNGRYSRLFGFRK